MCGMDIGIHLVRVVLLFPHFLISHSVGNNILIVAHASSLEACTRQLQGRSPQTSKDFIQVVRKVSWSLFYSLNVIFSFDLIVSSPSLFFTLTFTLCRSLCTCVSACVSVCLSLCLPFSFSPPAFPPVLPLLQLTRASFPPVDPLPGFLFL